MTTTGESLLGEPPEVPGEVWARALDAAFAADLEAGGDEFADLVPGATEHRADDAEATDGAGDLDEFVDLDGAADAPAHAHWSGDDGSDGDGPDEVPWTDDWSHDGNAHDALDGYADLG